MPHGVAVPRGRFPVATLAGSILSFRQFAPRERWNPASGRAARSSEDDVAAGFELVRQVTWLPVCPVSASAWQLSAVAAVGDDLVVVAASLVSDPLPGRPAAGRGPRRSADLADLLGDQVRVAGVAQRLGVEVDDRGRAASAPLADQLDAVESTEAARLPCRLVPRIATCMQLARATSSSSGAQQQMCCCTNSMSACRSHQPRQLNWRRRAAHPSLAACRAFGAHRASTSLRHRSSPVLPWKRRSTEIWRAPLVPFSHDLERSRASCAEDQFLGVFRMPAIVPIAARVRTLTGLNATFPSSLSQMSERRSDTTGHFSPPAIIALLNSRQRSETTPEGSPIENRVPSTCRITPGEAISAEQYTTHPIAVSGGITAETTPPGSTASTRRPAYGPGSPWKYSPRDAVLRRRRRRCPDAATARATAPHRGSYKPSARGTRCPQARSRPDHQ